MKGLIVALGVAGGLIAFSGEASAQYYRGGHHPGHGLGRHPDRRRQYPHQRRPRRRQVGRRSVGEFRGARTADAGDGAVVG